MNKYFLKDETIHEDSQIYHKGYIQSGIEKCIKENYRLKFDHYERFSSEMEISTLK